MLPDSDTIPDVLQYYIPPESPLPLDLPGQLRASLRELQTLVWYEFATLALKDPKNGETFTGLEVVPLEQLSAPRPDRGGGRLPRIPARRLAELLKSGEPLLLPTGGAPAPGEAEAGTGAPRWLALSLFSRNQSLGLLLLERRSGPFAEADQHIAAAFARQIAAAMDNAQLVRESVRRADEFGLLYRIARAASSLDLDDVLNVIYREVARALQPDSFFIALLDETESMLEYRVAYEMGQRLALSPESLATSPTLSAHIMRSGQSLLVGDLIRDAHQLPTSGVIDGATTHAFIGVPLQVAGCLMGVLSVQSFSPDQFDQEALRLLEAIAAHAAIAIQNARFTADTGRRLAEMMTLYDMAQKATSSLELSEVLDAIVSTLKELLKARSASIMLLDPDTETLSIRAASGIKEEWLGKAKLKLGQGTSGRVAASAAPEYVPDTHADPEFIFFDPTVRSLLTVPLKVKDRVIGTLSVDSDQPAAFTPHDERLLTIAGAQAAVAIENARLVADLRTRLHNLQEVDRLRDELIQNVSHELRTPLTFIKGYVDLLLDKEMGPLNDRQRHSLDVVQAKTTQLTRLVSDIISVQKIERSALDPHPLALDEVVALAIEAAQLHARSGGVTLRMETVTDRPLPLVMGDQDRLMQVLDNLLGNAVKFSSSGGEIVVRLGLAPGGRHAQVSVSDQGIGMPATDLKRIFERFYQIDSSTRRRFGGMGLGLAIVQRIVHAHHGQVWAESQPGRGSTFYFTIPIASGR
ncbi:MAG: GAF domain-containing protein [Chloroflexi bacterium]|nr:GAF domain-containing protein [Chloroflexota bacterium]